MLVHIDTAALRTIRVYLDETMFRLVDFRLGIDAPVGSTGFPSFGELEPVVSRLSLTHRTLFRLLRLGKSADHDVVSRVLPPAVLDALARTGLLTRDDQGQWCTPGLVLVPIEGLLVFVGVPPTYATSTRVREVRFDRSSFFVAKSLPGSLHGDRVLDLCSGSGVQSLLCAARGAESVTGLDIRAEAVEVARVNCELNRLSDRVSFRLSDKLSALAPDERFDFIVCNTPYAPLTDGAGEPMAIDDIGNRVLLSMLDQLPSHLSARGRGIVATWRSIGLAGATSQYDRIAARFRDAGFTTLAFVDRTADNVDGVLTKLRHDVEERHGPAEAHAAVERARTLLENAAMDGFYNQLVLIAAPGRDSDDVGVFGLSVGTPCAESAAS